MTQNIGKRHRIIVVVVCSDTANGKRGRKDKLIMGLSEEEIIKGRMYLKVVNPRMIFIV